MHRLQLLTDFYSLLDSLGLEAGKYHLRDCHGRMSWPNRGIYFFFDPHEARSDSGSGQRLIRIGTHALKDGSQTSLWTRLSQHKGQQKSGGGNHRGSIFRLLVGKALLQQGFGYSSTWGQGSSAARDTREAEREIEREVSRYIGDLQFVCLAITDPAGPGSLRGYIERNAIALVSNYAKKALDPLSRDWLGKSSGRERVRNSELWNQNHVDETCDPAFLSTMAKLIEAN